MQIVSRKSNESKPKEGQCWLLSKERKNIGQIISTEGKTSITIDDAYLLFEAVGSQIASHPMGGNDINAVSIVKEKKEFTMNIKRELCPPDSFRQMPVMVLVKCLAMRQGTEDMWCLAPFGTIAVREPHSKAYQRRKIKGVSRQLYAADAPAHIFTPIYCIGIFSTQSMDSARFSMA